MIVAADPAETSRGLVPPINENRPTAGAQPTLRIVRVADGVPRATGGRR
jgi:hypothetical protein